MNKNIILALIAILVLVGIAFWAFADRADDVQGTQTTQMTVTSGENPEPRSSVHDLPVEPAAAAARRDLAAKLGTPEKSIVIMQIDEKTWSDGCLGLGKPEEFCTQALIEGFRVEMLAEGKTYFYRTDKTGASVRAETN